jgi:hypothetical protein
LLESIPINLLENTNYYNIGDFLYFRNAFAKDEKPTTVLKIAFFFGQTPKTIFFLYLFHMVTFWDYCNTFEYIFAKKKSIKNTAHVLKINLLFQGILIFFGMEKFSLQIDFQKYLRSEFAFHDLTPI